MTPTAAALVLVADDNDTARYTKGRILRQAGFDVIEAANGTDALRAVVERAPRLVVLDVQMPDMDGFELAELMRGSERTRHVPIIFVTAGMRDQYRLFKGYDTGAVDFLHKPIEPHILKSKADVFFQLYRQKQQLARQLEELTETLRLNELFTAVLGHDLRNPLSAILNSANLLEHISKEDVVKQSAVRMVSSGRRMSRMIDDMLDLTRARLGGGIPLRLQETQLGRLVQRVIQEHQVSFPEGRFEMKQEGDLAGDWDADRLAQMASNLVGNALEHGEKQDAIEVTLNGTRADFVTLTVTNTGVIPGEVLPHLFDPFRGSQRHLGRRDGLGLGLYIVQQIVLAHRGRVDVLTDPKRTTFLVEIPRRASAQGRPGASCR
jgi:two-component system, sensor histidine kinase and response regulator